MYSNRYLNMFNIESKKISTSNHALLENYKKITMLLISTALVTFVSQNIAVASDQDGLSSVSMNKTAERSLYNDQYNCFDHFKAYYIPQLHEAGLTGKDYNVAIIESSAEVTHPALSDRIEIINPFMGDHNKLEEIDHGSHVSALVVGNKNQNFDGGIAPDAKAYLVVKGPNLENYDAQSELLISLKKAAELSPIINLSAYITGRGQSLREEFLKSLKEILDENDAVLVISGTNCCVTGGQSAEMNYLEDLVNYEDLAKRILIVGNLRYRTSKELVAEEKEKDAVINQVVPRLNNFIEKFANIKNICELYFDFKKYITVNNIDNDIFEFLNISGSRQMLPVNSYRQLKDLSTNEHIISYIINDLSKKIPSDELKQYLQEKGVTKATEIMKKVFLHMMEMPGIENYKSRDELKILLDDFLSADLKDDIFKSAFLSFYTISWTDRFDFLQTIQKIFSEATRAKNDSPFEKQESGSVASARAGTLKDHFLMTYGCGIRSAWEDDYAAQTGASMSTPITTGIMILLHQHLNKTLGQKTSWVEVLSLVKNNARAIGNPDAFGLGMLDTKRLFSTILNKTPFQQ